MLLRIASGGKFDAGCGTNHTVDRGPGKAGQVGVVAQCAGAPAGTFADRPDGSRRNDEQGHCREAGHRREQGGALAHPLRAKEGVRRRSRRSGPRGANHGGKDSRAQAALRTRVIEATTQTTPEDATHWSCRSMARHLGTTHSFVHRVWRSHGLKPHLIRTFKLSSDPRFEEKLQDVVGLYLDPPENAAVFSFDEKSQIQALDRTQPGLPMKKGRAGTMTHDYKRHGTTTLFAALEVASGKVIGRTYRRHRHQEVLMFLREVDKAVPADQEIHIVLDNYATHRHEKVQDWIERRKRIFLHFTPTGASWANLVERFFATLTDKQIRRGVFTSVPHLEECLREYLERHNENPQPLVWTKSFGEIMEKVERGRAALANAS